MSPLPKNEWSVVINCKPYSIKTAKLLASDCYWDGSNFHRNGRNLFLYRTPKRGLFHHFCYNVGERA